MLQYSNSTTNISYKSKEQQWVPRWHQHMQTFYGKIERKIKRCWQTTHKLWKQFIDDIFVIWTGSKPEFITFMTEINQIHNTIKFTYEVSETELTFLDITLYKGERFDTHPHKTNKQTAIYSRYCIPPPNYNKCRKQGRN